MKRKVSIGILISIMIFSLAMLNSMAYAYKKVIYTTPLLYAVYDKNIVELTHSSGKYIFAYFDSSNLQWVVTIFNPNGDYESEIVIPRSYTSSSMGISVSQYDDNEILVADMYRTSAGSYIYFTLWKMNINSYTKVQVGSTQTVSPAMANFRFTMTKAIKYNDNYYWIIRVQSLLGDTANRIYLLRLVDSTSTLSILWNKATGETSTNPPGHPPLWHMQDSAQTNKIYFLTTDADDEEKPTYYILDLDGGSGDCLKLAGHPVTDRIDPYSVNYQQYFIEAGKVTSGDLIYLYWTWLKPDLYYTEYRKIMVIQHRLIFNTTVSPGTLEASNERFVQIYPNLLTSPTYNCWALGYLQTKETLYVYYPYIEAEQYKIMKHKFNIPNWFDIYENSINSVTYTETTDIPPQKSVIDYICRDMTSQFQLNCQYTGADFWIYSGLVAMEREYDIEETYTPYEDPMFTNKNYRFTLSATMNGYGKKLYIFLYIDGTEYSSMQTQSNGIVEYTAILSISGNHNFTYRIFDYGEFQYTETFMHMFIESEDEIPSPEVLIPVSTNLLLIYLPVMIIYSVVTLSFSKIANFAGFIIGVALSTVICSMAGLIPTYFVYVIILGIVGSIIILSRS